MGTAVAARLTKCSHVPGTAAARASDWVTRSTVQTLARLCAVVAKLVICATSRALKVGIKAQVQLLGSRPARQAHTLPRLVMARSAMGARAAKFAVLAVETVLTLGRAVGTDVARGAFAAPIHRITESTVFARTVLRTLFTVAVQGAGPVALLARPACLADALTVPWVAPMSILLIT